MKSLSRVQLFATPWTDPGLKLGCPTLQADSLLSEPQGSFFLTLPPALIKVLCIPSGSVVKNLLPMQKMRVQSLVQEDLLEKEMATHSSIFVWEIPRTEEPGRLQPTGLQRVGHD